MKNLRSLNTILRLLLVVACLQLLALAQAPDNGVTLSGIGSTVRWDVAVPHSELTLTISAPDGQVFRKEFKGRSAEFALTDEKGDRLADGQYTYELRVTPLIPSDVKDSLAAARTKGNAEDVRRDLIKRGALQAQPLVVSGGFAILHGSVIVPGALEEAGSARAVAATPPRTFRPVASVTRTFRTNTAAAMSGFRSHHAVVNPFFDFVIADDLIVQGSACVGLDCVDGESFGFDTIRVKENNDRIQFDDTSASAGFPSNNWQIRANASGSGGGNFLAFVDQGTTGNSETGTIVFEVDAGAPTNSLRVSSSGNIGIGTATPVLDIHDNASDTPAIRLEQNNTGGFTAQTWDVAGNEANFFVRDVTSGSRLPFRIRPGAPTSSIDIAANGNVGMGTASPGTALDISGNTATVGSDLNATTRTNATTKVSRVAMPPFTTGNLNFAYAAAAATSTDNIAALGGAAGGFSAATVIVFNTAANTNTDTGTERMRITSVGRVGIGTTAPDQLLSVNGDASKVGGGSWQTFSDERLKSIRGPFISGLNAVMRLQPVRYEYKPNNAM